MSGVILTCPDFSSGACFSIEKNFLVMKNDLQLRDEKVDSMGIGLKNLSSRYEAISDMKPQFSVSGKYYVAKIPLLKAE